MNVLGISCYYHDSSVCLIQDGRVVFAAAEERFSRVKHDNGFPVRAIDACLSWANMSPEDVTAVAFYEKPLWKFDRILSQHIEAFPRGLSVFTAHIGSWFGKRLRLPETLKKESGIRAKTYYVPHHVSHAAVSYYPSGFDRAAIVTIDGVGEWATTTMGYGDRGRISLDREIRFPHSLGLLYSAITAYLGFDVNDAEYKVMGYAAYGHPEARKDAFSKLITFFEDGSYALNMEYFTYDHSDRMYNHRLEQLFGLPTRKKESGIQKDYADIAASLQQTLEQAVFRLLCAAHGRYKTKNLCLSGGVALNSVMNGKILQHTPFQRVYVPPDPGDGGGAMGAAMHVYTSLSGHAAWNTLMPSLGPSYTDEQMEDVLRQYPVTYRRVQNDETLVSLAASYLARQKVIGWFQGRMEWGPRALGFRSILASAEKPEMKDKINRKVKHRELFRPFAPAILDRYVHSYFRADTPLPSSCRYMLHVYPFTSLGKQKAAATVHVDGTGRLQVVDKKDNPLYYRLLEAYMRMRGTPVILNTSFNVRGEPIVCTPRDAIACFLKTDIDYLVMGPFIVRKKRTIV